MGILKRRALLLAVYVGAPDFWKLLCLVSQKIIDTVLYKDFNRDICILRI